MDVVAGFLGGGVLKDDFREVEVDAEVAEAAGNDGVTLEVVWVARSASKEI